MSFKDMPINVLEQVIDYYQNLEKIVAKFNDENTIEKDSINSLNVFSENYLNNETTYNKEIFYTNDYSNVEFFLLYDFVTLAVDFSKEKAKVEPVLYIYDSRNDNERIYANINEIVEYVNKINEKTLQI